MRPSKILKAICLLAITLCLTGCLDIVSVNQPSAVNPGEQFVVTVNFDTAAPEGGDNISRRFGAIKVPLGSVFLSADAEALGQFTRDAVIEAQLTIDYPPGGSYEWWAGPVASPTTSVNTYVVTIAINATGVSGTYYLDYRVGKHLEDVFTYYDESLNHQLIISSTPPDTDNDGWSNVDEGVCETDPLDNLSVPLDTDGDLVCNFIDTDDDNDAWSDADEGVCGADALDNLSVPLDTDGDLICDLIDTDNDNDGSSNAKELQAGTDPLDSAERPYWHMMLNGYGDNDLFGSVVSEIGNIPSDGHPAMIINSPGYSNYGAIDAYDSFTGYPIYRDVGSGSRQWKGEIEYVGDANGDGNGDFVMGYYNSVTAECHVSLVNGYAAWILIRSWRSCRGGDYNYPSYLGSRVSWAGDVNNDGYDDYIAVGGGSLPVDPPFTGEPGAVVVYSGLDGSTLHGDSFYNSEAICASGIGDINLDGFDDVAVCENSQLKIHSGVNWSTILYVIAISNGSKVERAGDINNDGYPDILVVYKNDGSNNSKVQVFSGVNGGLLYDFIGEGIGSGATISRGGDINGDGYEDVIIGAHQVDSGRGKVYIFSGIDGSQMFSINGDSTTDYFGYSVSAIGDIDSDGYDDLLIGAPYDDNNGVNSGSARIILAKDLMNDLDADNIVNSADVFPNDSTEWADTDSDGTGNNADWDDDNDGVPDMVDAEPLNNANNNEITLPLDGNYSGLQYKQTK